MQMSFLTLLHHNSPQKYIERKEKQDSLMVNKKTFQIKHSRERASAFTSKGSITLEASIVVPIFFFAIVSLAYLMEMMTVQTTVRNALCDAAKELAREAYVHAGVTSYEVERRMVEHIGAGRLERSIIAGGADGIDCTDTEMDVNTGVIDMHAQYRIQIPIPMFRIASILCEESIRAKGWNGYSSSMYSGMHQELVYVTETGIVYHSDANCTYLDMTIRAVHPKEIENMRNQSGAKYYPCESCGSKSSENIHCYVTDYGTRYHTSLECKKIKRTIYAVPLEETFGLGGCSKCVK